MGFFGNGCDSWIWVLIIIILVSGCSDGGLFSGNNGCGCGCDNNNGCC